MKAEKRPNGKIVIKKKEDNMKIVDNALLKIMKHMTQFKLACEDRNLEKFPSDDVKAILDNCKIIRNSIDDIEVPEEYFTYVLEKKNVGDYYKEKLEELDKEKQRYLKKREAFNRFHGMLQVVQKNHFSNN